ncbi:NAD(P)/FAD-dependent oxidoreductase [Sphingomonas radiodurans]|uniref:NAD(P)/FAD-dependent oxidoreductase n=1 Tax=Sphingomonas radiodurans TaxID=2890321 RepID=UPI001E5630C7|nr:NAD(P)/FAD-dependent oxidoreductase [Sphingomonas radiodurans]WBH15118.1 NAD(P)/FAD-dependent oxidoreductase [Sphingomonas radiodurans]
MAQQKTQIVVVGGGAGGLELVRKLGARYGRKQHDIILVDRNLTHIWKPLLHEVAAGSLDANLDEVGYGGHAVRWGYRFFNGSIESIDRAARTITTTPLLDERGEEIIGRHSIRYDYLVMAIGGISNDFGVPGVREHAMFLEDRPQADRFRQKLLNVCLRTNHAHQTGRPEARVRVSIVGGGATGVELAAELYNAAKALRHYGLEVFDESKLEVSLIEAGLRILPALDETLAATAKRELEYLGVRVLDNTQVVRVAERAVHTGDGGVIDADLIVWAAGVKGAEEIKTMSDLELTRGNQIVVRPTLQSTSDDRIYALGDCASCLLPGRDRPIPPRAQSAHQMASLIFANLVRAQAGDPLKDFVYQDHGSLVSLSRFSTVGSLMGNLVGGRMRVEGWIARTVYMSLYRMHLIAIHGWWRGVALIVIGHVNQIVRPKLKLH